VIAGKDDLQIVADVAYADLAGLKAELGITPAIEKQFALAARSIRKAIDQVDKALQLAEPDSDTAQRCSEAIEELREVLSYAEWEPSRS
jgi:hypothetical protein